MFSLPGVTLFDTTTEQRPSMCKPLENIRVLGDPPEAFHLGLYLAMSILLLTNEESLFMARLQGGSSFTHWLSLELLFHFSVGLLLLTIRLSRAPIVLVLLMATGAAGVLLNALYPGKAITSDLFYGHWGNFSLWVATGIACYRFPTRWAWSVIGTNLLLLILTNGGSLVILATLTGREADKITLIIALGGLTLLCILGWTQRARAIQLIALQEVQMQLRWQIEHAEMLAAMRERTQIARDIHDVLAHSLTVLSIQVQAARQLVHHDPDRLVQKLEDMAALLRESQAESRRAIGLLREPSTHTSIGCVGTLLQAEIDLFSERTGVRCFFAQKGIPYPINDVQYKTIHYALRESLTNAHRHGQARMVWSELRWQEEMVVLSVRDNGHVQHNQQAIGEAKAHAAGGHHGLQGMRERAGAIGGRVEASPCPDGGFRVQLSFPLKAAISQGVYV